MNECMGKKFVMWKSAAYGRTKRKKKQITDKNYWNSVFSS